jgi:plastocyanin
MKHMTRFRIVAATVGALLTLAACSSSSSPSSSSSTPTSTPTSSTASTPAASSSTPAASGPTITISNFSYTGTLTVKAGTKITVVNMDSAAHTLTDKKSGKFDTGTVAGSGGTATFIAPNTPGTYQFGCSFHPAMAGTLIVTP